MDYDYLPQIEDQDIDITLFRREVRKSVRFLVLLMAAYFGVNITATGIATGIAFVLSPDFLGAILNEMSGTSLPDPLAIMESVDSMLTGSSIIWATSVGAVAGALMLMIPRGKRFFSDIALPSEKKWTPLAILILIVTMFALQEIVTLVIGGIDAALSGIDGDGASVSGSYESLMDGFVNPAGIIYVVIIGPLFEELVFRGAILGQLRKFGTNFAIVTSALFFGFFHMVPAQIPTGIILGLLLGYAACRYSLRMSILLHVINNSVAMLQMWFGEDSAISKGLSIAVLICGIAAVLILVPNRKRFAAIVHSCKNPIPRTNVWGITTELFIIFMLGCLAAGVFFTMAPGMIT